MPSLGLVITLLFAAGDGGPEKGSVQVERSPERPLDSALSERDAGARDALTDGGPSGSVQVERSRDPLDSARGERDAARDEQTDGGPLDSARGERDAGSQGEPALDGVPQAPLTPDELEALAERGRAVYRKHECGACHSTDGSDGTAPTLLGLWGQPVKLKGGATVVADEAYLRESILKSTAKVVEGYPPLMPLFKDVLTAEEVDLLVAFIRALGEG